MKEWISENEETISTFLHVIFIMILIATIISVKSSLQDAVSHIEEEEIKSINETTNAEIEYWNTKTKLLELKGE